MDHEPLPNDALAAIEACRMDSDDERLPEIAATLAGVSPVRVAELRRSIERADRAIAAAVQQAPAPDGLAERVLARIQEEDVTRVAATFGVIEVPEPAPCRKHGRRSWLMAGVGMAIAASLLVVFAWPRSTIELAEIEAQARELYEADDHRATSSSEKYPTSLGGVAADTVRGWHAVKFLGRSGYAYELAKRRVNGTLYVVPLGTWFGSKLDLSAGSATQSTSGTTVATWTDGAEVYVLVIKGDPRSLHFFVPRRLA